MNWALTAEATEEVEGVFDGRGGDIFGGATNAISEVVATSVARMNGGGGGGDTSDVSVSDGCADDSVVNSVNELLADELAGDGGDETELENTDGGDGGGDNGDGEDDTYGDQEVSAALLDSDDSVMKAITKCNPQMKMKRKRLSKVSHCKVISCSCC